MVQMAKASLPSVSEVEAKKRMVTTLKSLCRSILTRLPVCNTKVAVGKDTSTKKPADERALFLFHTGIIHCWSSGR